MLNVEFSYEVNGMNNYLTAKCSGPINKYQLKMLENNQIPGLLPVHSRQVNGRYCVEYDITGMRKVKKVLGANEIRGKAAKTFLSNMLCNLMAIEEYFLSYTQCLLEMEYLFVDERNEVRMVYLPVMGEQPTTEQSVRELCLSLLAEYFTSDKDLFFMELLRYVNMRDFSLEGLRKRMEADRTEADRTEEEKAFENRPAEAVHESAGAKEEKQKAKPAPAQAAGGFAVPGGLLIPGGNAAVPETLKPDKDKKQGLLKKLLGSNKKTGEAPAADSSASGHAVAPERAGRHEEPAMSAGETPVWQGTQMAAGAASLNHTVILGGDSTPYLLHKNQRIDLIRFPFTLGKQDTDYTITSNVVSRSHASISCQNGNYYLTDENSKNHTYVNGRQLPPFTEEKLQDGDVIRLANEDMTFYTGA